VGRVVPHMKLTHHSGQVIWQEEAHGESAGTLVPFGDGYMSECKQKIAPIFDLVD
jgi:hypothetical protein